MQRRKPITRKHQERRHRALERLLARIRDRQKGKATDAQAAEIASLTAALAPWMHGRSA